MDHHDHNTAKKLDIAPPSGQGESSAALHQTLGSSTVMSELSADHINAITNALRMDGAAVEHTSARAAEKAKSELEKRKDWAYTANHALFCLASDTPDIGGRWWLNNFESGKKFSDAVVNPVVKYSGLGFLGAQKDKFFSLPAFEGVRSMVDSAFGKLTEEERTDRAMDRFFNKNKGTQLAREAISELIGDSIAVPFTIALQRTMPGFMNGLSKAGEKIQGGMYANSTMREAKSWGKRHGYAEDSEQVKEKQQELYKYEVGHLSQAYSWTVSSMFFNAASSKFFGNKSTYGRLVANNVISASTTFALVTAGRVCFPRAASRADAWTKRTFIDPVFGNHDEHMALATSGGYKMAGGMYVPDPTTHLTGDKRDQLTHMVAEHALDSVARGEKATEFVVNEKEVLLAMADVFTNDQDFINQFAAMHQQEMEKLYAHSAGHMGRDLSSLTDAEISKESVLSILNNRATDLRSLAAGLNRASIRNEIAELTAHPEVVAKLPEFPDKKRESFIDSLVQSKQRKTGEPAVHIYATARGHMLEHHALLKCYDPEGPLADKLLRALQTRLPEMDEGKLTAITKGYMQDRKEAADLVVEHFTPDSEMVTDAVIHSAELKQHHQHAHAASGH